MKTSRAWKYCVAAIALGLLGTVCFWQLYCNSAKYRVAQILLSDSSPQSMVNELAPYVQLNDSYPAVAARLGLQADPNEKMTRPAYWGIGLDGVHLELALRTDGTVAGIGRYIPGGRHPDGPEWLVGHDAKWWESPLEIEN